MHTYTNTHIYIITQALQGKGGRHLHACSPLIRCIYARYMLAFMLAYRLAFMLTYMLPRLAYMLACMLAYMLA